MHELSNALGSCGEAASNHEVTDSDMADGDIPPGEWEGKIVGEVFVDGILKYKIAWEPSFEPKENVGREMM